MTIAMRLEYPRILSASIATLLLAAGLPAQSRYLGQLDGQHTVPFDYTRSGRCTFVDRVRDDRPLTFDPGTFDIFPPGAFSCQPFRFGDGRAVVNHPDVPVIVELADPTAAPTVVNLSDPRDVTTGIALTGRATFRDGGDDHAIRIGVEVGLDPATGKARDQLTCSRQAAFVSSSATSRLIVADALCGVSVMDVVGAVKMADVGGVMTVTEFSAEVVSEFYIVMDHGSADDGKTIRRGARLIYTVKSRYKFQLADDRLQITGSLPPNKNDKGDLVDLTAGDVTNFEATVRFSLLSQEMANIVLNIFNEQGEVLATGGPVRVKSKDSCLGGDDTEACPVTVTIENFTIPDEGPLFLAAAMNDLTGVEIVQSNDIVYNVTEGDFEVLHIEVTQAIQDNPNLVPLVAGKKTVVRVFVQGTGDTARVPVELALTRGGNSESLMGQSLPVNSETSEIEGLFAARVSNLNPAAVFVLDREWTRPGDLSLKARVVREEPVIGGDFPELVTFKQRNLLSIGAIKYCRTRLSGERACPADAVMFADGFLRKVFPAAEGAGVAYIPLDIPFFFDPLPAEQEPAADIQNQVQMA